MGDYTYASYTNYRFDGSGVEPEYDRFQYNGNDGTIVDPTNGAIPRIRDDDTFQATERITLQPDPVYAPGLEVELAYVGTIDISGVTYPVFEDIYLGDIYLFNQEDTLLPFNIDPDDINDGNEYYFGPSCFARGTAIATPDGPRAVEALIEGDHVLTADGRAVPVLWAARQTVLPRVAPERMQPVRIAAGALGEGLPARDLIVTADHGMVVDGLLVNAAALVNGRTIRFVPVADLPLYVTYYHLETAAHEVLLAEDLPTESFIDYAGRDAFDNHADYVARHGAERIIREMDLPRVTSQRMLPPRLKAKLGIDAPVLTRVAAA